LNYFEVYFQWYFLNKGKHKLPNSEQSYKGKVKTHNYINRQISQQPENCENRNDPDLAQAFLKKWWVESDFKALNLPLSTDQNNGVSKHGFRNKS
jgi:hypothetical protein